MILRSRVLALLLAALAGPAAIAELRLVEPRTAGGAYRLELGAETASWSEVAIERLAVHSAGGLASLDRGPRPATRTLELELVTPGCSLIEADLVLPAGVPARRRSAKFVVCPPGGGERELATRRRAGALLTAKTGAAREIRPLFNPATLAPGADLAVRLYRGGRALPGAELEAIGPAGAVRVAADGVGIAVVPIATAGAWRLRFADSGGSAELSFRVPAGGAR